MTSAGPSRLADDQLLNGLKQEYKGPALEDESAHGADGDGQDANPARLPERTNPLPAGTRVIRMGRANGRVWENRADRRILRQEVRTMRAKP